MIDFKQGVIKGKSGKIYKISPETLSVHRFPFWEIYTSTLAFSMSYQQIAEVFVNIINELSKPLTGITIANILNECNQRLDIVKNHPNAESIPRVVSFCATFCVTDDEDLSKFDDALVRQKHEDWKHIPIQDFFLLYRNLIPTFNKDYQNQIQKENQI
jgi:hypothetical protein